MPGSLCASTREPVKGLFNSDTSGGNFGALHWTYSGPREGRKRPGECFRGPLHEPRCKALKFLSELAVDLQNILTMILKIAESKLV